MTVIALHERGATLVEAGTPPRVLARYDHPPWAAGACLAGTVWARVADDCLTVRLYTVVKVIAGAPVPATAGG